MVKSLPAMQEIQETQVRSLGWEDPLEEQMQPTQVFLPEKSHGQRSLLGCKELDTTELTCKTLQLYLNQPMCSPPPIPFTSLLSRNNFCLELTILAIHILEHRMYVCT